MTHDNDTNYEATRTPEETELQRELRELPRPVAPAEFRADMKQAFRHGEIEPRVSPIEVGEIDEPTSAAAPPEPIAITAPISRRVLPWVTVAAVAAAAVFLAVLLNPTTTSEWKVVAANSGGRLVVEGQSFDLSDLSGLPALAPGQVVEYEGEGTLELLASGFWAIELAPASTLELPVHTDRPSSTAESGQTFACRVDRGIARFVTGPDFAGNALWVSAQGTEVEVTGTTFSVLASSDKTCVSVLEGKVSVRAADGSVVPVSAGSCRTVYLDARPALDHALDDGQRTSLTALFERGSEYFGH